jgi:hypothetical protein
MLDGTPHTVRDAEAENRIEGGFDTGLKTVQRQNVISREFHRFHAFEDHIILSSRL